MTIDPKNIEYWQLLWLKFKSGDRDSFEEIYQEFIDRLFAYGSKMTTDRELIRREDLLRQGKFITFALARGVKNAQDFRKLFPIPQTEINANPLCKQNPGY